jgi:TetR/AcrR family transcriptional regulator, cholesterol catabolism regulator
MATTTRMQKGSRGRSARGRKPRDPDGTREALLKSALALFEELGYDATSVQQIVDDAGRTKGAFYHHFQSKEDLLRDLHDEFVVYQLEKAHEVKDRDTPADEKLRQLVTEVLMEPLSIYKSEITVFLQERRFLSEDAFAEIRTKRDEVENIIVDVIREGMETGVFKPVGTPRLVAFGVIGMCAWSYTWLEAKGTTSPHDIGEMYGSILVDGLVADG